MSHTTHYDERCDVVVVGAGISGLKAAKDLQNTYGLKVIVLEARSNVGGRMQEDWTFLDGRPVELGAEFIHGDRNPVVELCEEQGWKRRHIFTWSHGDGGPGEGPAPDMGIGYYYLGQEKKLLRYDADDADLKKCNETLWKLCEVPSEVADKDRRTLRQYLIDEGVPERMLGLACAGYCNTVGGTADTLPVGRAMKLERAFAMEDTELEPDFRLEPSFNVLIDFLAKGLDIRLNHPVASIQVLDPKGKDLPQNEDTTFSLIGGSGVTDTPPNVVVTTKDGKRFAASKVSVCVPLSVHRNESIKYDPPLRREKVAASKSMAFANGVKIALKFKARAWPWDCHGAVCADSFVPEMWMNSTAGVGGIMEGCEYVEPPPPNTPSGNICGIDPSASVSINPKKDPPGTIYVVTGFLMGPRADSAVQNYSQSVIIAKFLAQIDNIFGMNAREHFVEGFVFDWSKEQYINGAYFTPTFDADYHGAALISEPHLNTVFFGGECTAGAEEGVSNNAGGDFAPPVVMHGAYISGLIAAKSVVRSLGYAVEENTRKEPYYPTYKVRAQI